MIVPDEVLKVLPLQRTHYMKGISNHKMKQEFSKDMVGEYKSLKAFLPSKCGAVLDIGCGIGGIDLHLFQHYADLGHHPKFYLVDKDGISDKLYYGFREKAAHYHFLSLTRLFLEANNVPPHLIFPVLADEFRSEIPKFFKFDLVVSLYSWGYYYPVETYLSEVIQRTKKGSRIILDVRINSGGLDAIRSAFGRVGTVVVGPTFNKRNRVIIFKEVSLP